MRLGGGGDIQMITLERHVPRLCYLNSWLSGAEASSDATTSTSEFRLARDWLFEGMLRFKS